MTRILVTTSSFGIGDPEPLRMLEAAGLEVTLNPHGRALTEPEVLELLVGVDGLIAGTEPLTRAVMVANPQLKVISRVGAGMDNVDRDAAAELDIAVYNTPMGPALAVAELTLALVLDVLRGVSRADRRIRGGVWKKEMGSLLSGKTVGIVGFGNVGRTFASLLPPFHCRVLVFDPFVDCSKSDPALAAVSCTTLEDLLSSADIVSVHCVLCEETRRLIGRDHIALMKPGAVLVNTTRGGIVDEEALTDTLTEGRLSGAALDVFESEPYTGSLVERDDVVLSPHVGSYAVEARASMERDAVTHLLVGLGLA